MPTVNMPIMNRVAYHNRTGVHDVTDFDWENYICLLYTSLVRHQKGRYFVESFAQETFEIEVSRVGSRLVEIRLCRFPEYRVVPDGPFHPVSYTHLVRATQ